MATVSALWTVIVTPGDDPEAEPRHPEGDGEVCDDDDNIDERPPPCPRGLVRGGAFRLVQVDAGAHHPDERHAYAGDDREGAEGGEHFHALDQEHDEHERPHRQRQQPAAEGDVVQPDRGGGMAGGVVGERLRAYGFPRSGRRTRTLFGVTTIKQPTCSSSRWLINPICRSALN